MAGAGRKDAYGEGRYLWVCLSKQLSEQVPVNGKSEFCEKRGCKGRWRTFDAKKPQPDCLLASVILMESIDPE
ncbi:MAG: hypothetical protein N3H30_00410 [Candidatus Micrarchaeota archaeon]|nr:hypothetical protein [Candidatus Micrarchaeota archaeon]